MPQGLPRGRSATGPSPLGLLPWLIDACIAAARVAAGALTGSGALLAGGTHAATDLATRTALLHSRRRGRTDGRSPTSPHPAARHRERLFWPLGVGMLAAGAGAGAVTLAAGSRFPHPGALTEPGVAVSAATATLLWKAVPTARSLLRFRAEIAAGLQDAPVAPPAGGITGSPGSAGLAALPVGAWRRLVSHTARPEVTMAALLDVASATGALTVSVAVTTAALTDDPLADAIGMLVVGGLMAVTAVAQVLLMKETVVGHSVAGIFREQVTAAIEIEPTVVRLVHVELHERGPHEILIGAKVELIAGIEPGDVTETARRLQASLRRILPVTPVLYLEPALCRTDLPHATSEAPGERAGAGSEGASRETPLNPT